MIFLMRYLLALAVLPGVALIVYIYSLDKEEPEPPLLLLKLTGLGALTVFSAFLLELCGARILTAFANEGTEFYTFLNCFFVIAVAEEAGKLFVLKKFAWRDKNFDYMFDGVVYGVCVGLGFAILENIFYVFRSGPATAVARALTAIPGHATFGIYMGWYMSCAKYYQCAGSHFRYRCYNMLSFVTPVILHGFYDFCLMSQNNMYQVVFYVFIIILYAKTFLKVKHLARTDKPISRQGALHFGIPFANAENISDNDYFG